MTPNYFSFFVKIEPFLFETLNIETKAGLFLACLVLCLLAVSYEGLRVARDILLRRREDADRKDWIATISGERSRLQSPGLNFRPRHFREWLGYSLLQSVLHMLQLIVVYTLMLSVMTFNAWILMSIVFGAGFGYLVLGPWSIFSPSTTVSYVQKEREVPTYCSTDTSTLNGSQTSIRDLVIQESR